MALNDIIALLLGGTSPWHLPAKQSVWVISKYFIGKMYCPDWLANIPRSHSVVRSIRVVTRDQRAMMSSWGTARSGRENLSITCSLDVKGNSLEAQYNVLLEVLSSGEISWLIGLKFPNQTTPLHYAYILPGFETQWNCFLCLPESAMLFLLCFAKLLLCSSKRSGFSVVFVRSACGAHRNDLGWMC